MAGDAGFLVQSLAAGLPVAVTVENVAGVGSVGIQWMQVRSSGQPIGTVTGSVGATQLGGAWSVVGSVAVTQASSPWIIQAGSTGAPMGTVIVSSIMGGGLTVTGSVLATQGGAPWSVVGSVGVTQITSPWMVQAGSTGAPMGTVVASVIGQPTVTASLVGVPTFVGSVAASQAGAPWSVVGSVGVTQVSSPWVVLPGSTGQPQGTVVASIIGQPTVTASVVGQLFATTSISGVPTFVGSVAASQAGAWTVTGSVLASQGGAPWTVLGSAQVFGTIPGSAQVSSAFPPVLFGGFALPAGTVPPSVGSYGATTALFTPTGLQRVAVDSAQATVIGSVSGTVVASVVGQVTVTASVVG